MRLFWFCLGWCAVALGAIGALAPLLPTVPFLLLAAFCFARSSQRFHDWLLSHPRFGPPIADWRENGAIRRWIKWLATGSMAISFAIPLSLGGGAAVLAVQVCALACVKLFIWTRPER